MQDDGAGQGAAEWAKKRAKQTGRRAHEGPGRQPPPPFFSPNQPGFIYEVKQFGGPGSHVDIPGVIIGESPVRAVGGGLSVTNSFMLLVVRPLCSCTLNPAGILFNEI